MAGKSPYGTPEGRVYAAAKAFDGVEGCWDWPLSRNPQTGYGHFHHRKNQYTAHRVSYSVFHGPIPPWLYVLHKCDNRACFNPAHLYAGTQKQNMEDMDARGRRNTAKGLVPWAKLHPELMPRGADHHLTKDPSCLPRGAQHHRAKLTDADVHDIRTCGDSLAVMGRRYGMSEASLSAVRRGETWRHVKTPGYVCRSGPKVNRK